MCCCCCGVMHQEQHLHPTSHFLLSTVVPIKPLLLSPPLSESGRHPLSRCGGVQTTGLDWKSMFIQRMRDRAKSSHYRSTVCMLLVRCAPGAACTTTTHHWQPQGGFTTAIAGEPSVPTVTVTKESHTQAVYSPFSRPRFL